LSVLVPVYNERIVLPLLYERLRTVLNPLDLSYELVMVDDGSQDGSGDYLVELARISPRVKTIRLSRNFGKEAALTAGLAQARGDVVIILDADLQDPPELIPAMLAAWRGGADVVCMRRRSRAGETRFKRLSAHLFYRLLNRISDVEIPEDTGDFRLMSRQAVNALNQLDERNRYMKGLFAWIGLPTQVIEYDRAPRAAGSTKWNYPGLLGLAFQGITSFSIAPLRLAMGIGLLTALAGMGFGAWIITKTLIFGDPVQGYPSLIAVITFFGGVQLLSVGLLGEYVGKTYFEAKRRPIYLIRDIVYTGPAAIRTSPAPAKNKPAKKTETHAASH
jgi:glycosyltransferase involved in cell wall biosynthesis